MGKNQPNEIESGEKAVSGTLKEKIENAGIEGCFQKNEIILSLDCRDVHILKSRSNDSRKIQGIFHSTIETLGYIGYVVKEKERGFYGEGRDFVFTLTHAPHLDTLSRLRLRNTMNKGTLL